MLLHYKADIGGRGSALQMYERGTIADLKESSSGTIAASQLINKPLLLLQQSGTQRRFKRIEQSDKKSQDC
jgi:hypothetical protein